MSGGFVGGRICGVESWVGHSSACLKRASLFGDIIRGGGVDGVVSVLRTRTLVLRLRESRHSSHAQMASAAGGVGHASGGGDAVKAAHDLCVAAPQNTQIVSLCGEDAVQLHVPHTMGPSVDGSASWSGSAMLSRAVEKCSGSGGVLMCRV